MKQLLLYTIPLIFFLDCSTKEKLLTSESWSLYEGQYLGQKIDFVSTDVFKLADRNGNLLKNLNFSKDGYVYLPGINSPSIRTKWILVNNQIKFEIDSTYYNSYYNDEKNLNHKELVDLTGSKIEIDSTENMRKENFKNSNPLLTNAFEKAMEVYTNPFEIGFIDDQLILESKTTKLIAYVDRSVDEFLKLK